MMLVHNIYITLNDDWFNNGKCKYGYVWGGFENLVNRINDSIEQHSDDYYEKISGLFDEIFVIDPINHYNGFNWNMLIPILDTPCDEIYLCIAIDKILTISEYKSSVESFEQPIKKLEYLNSIDERIPINAKDYYATELHYIHIIFAMRKHSRTR
jgi:hypothetical protein